jgi:hypothetical protein
LSRYYSEYAHDFCPAVRKFDYSETPCIIISFFFKLSMYYSGDAHEFLWHYEHVPLHRNNWLLLLSEGNILSSYFSSSNILLHLTIEVTTAFLSSWVPLEVHVQIVAVLAVDYVTMLFQLLQLTYFEQNPMWRFLCTEYFIKQYRSCMIYTSINLSRLVCTPWSSTWNTRTAGGKQRYLRGYAKTSYGAYKIGGRIYYCLIHYFECNLFNLC